MGAGDERIVCLMDMVKQMLELGMLVRGIGIEQNGQDELRAGLR